MSIKTSSNYEDEDPEDILSSSLQTLYRYAPITHSSAGKVFIYATTSANESISSPTSTVTLDTPDTQPENWSLHASSIWVSSIYIADHLCDLFLDRHHDSTERKVHVLELGAGAGLPSILIAKTYPFVRVTVSDYPDESLMKTLLNNVEHNGVSNRCRVVPYAWGADTSALTKEDGPPDVIVAADTLWNPDLHILFLDTLRKLLKKTPEARVHLIAGLHTGRYTLEAFLQAVGVAGLEIQSVLERKVAGDATRKWEVARAEQEDEEERRQWVVWMVLKWPGEVP